MAGSLSELNIGAVEGQAAGGGRVSKDYQLARR